MSVLLYQVRDEAARSLWVAKVGLSELDHLWYGLGGQNRQQVGDEEELVGL